MRWPKLWYLESSARLQGLEEDLKLTGHQFNTLISIVFVGYFLMQVPSYVYRFSFFPSIIDMRLRNIFLERLTRPSAYFSCIAISWGLLSIGIGLCRVIFIVHILCNSTPTGVAKRSITPKSVFDCTTWLEHAALTQHWYFVSCLDSRKRDIPPVCCSCFLDGMYPNYVAQGGIAYHFRVPKVQTRWTWFEDGILLLWWSS